MRIVLFTVLTAFCAQAGAAKSHAVNKVRQPAQVETKSELAAVFAAYLQCAPADLGNLKTLEPIRKCVKPLLTPALSAAQADRFATWLLLPVQVPLIRDCSPRELDLRKLFPGKTDEALCFDLRIGSEIKTGIVFFKTLEKRHFLHAFDY